MAATCCGRASTIDQPKAPCAANCPERVGAVVTGCASPWSNRPGHVEIERFEEFRSLDHQPVTTPVTDGVTAIVALAAVAMMLIHHDLPQAVTPLAQHVAMQRAAQTVPEQPPTAKRRSLPTHKAES
jgi:hypothetical protein